MHIDSNAKKRTVLASPRHPTESCRAHARAHLGVVEEPLKHEEFPFERGGESLSGDRVGNLILFFSGVLICYVFQTGVRSGKPPLMVTKRSPHRQIRASSRVHPKRGFLVLDFLWGGV